MTAGIDDASGIAEQYDDGRSLSAEALHTWAEAVRPHLPLDGAIVDIGAGTGRFARPLAKLAERPVVAVEPSTGMRTSALRVQGDACWVAGSAEALPLADRSVGLAWSAFTTHYFDLQRVGAELARVLRPDGRVLIWHAFPDVFDDLEWFRWFPSAPAIDEDRMPSADAVVDAFESTGLRFVGRSDHRMLITRDLRALADRLAHRSISTLHLIPDRDVEEGLRAMRTAAARRSGGPIHAPNVMLRFDVPA